MITIKFSILLLLIILLLITCIIVFIIIYTRIDYAQPAQAPPYQAFLDPTLSSLIKHSGSNDENNTSGTSNSNSDDNLFCVGDHRETATLNGALVSGRRAAELIIKSRK
jgi:uncharacterized SAM-binding protein YcdF (DUF218 family)